MQWDNGSTNSYRMGKEGKYDLKLVDSPLPQPPESESDTEEEEGMFPCAALALLYFFRGLLSTKAK